MCLIGWQITHNLPEPDWWVWKDVFFYWVSPIPGTSSARAKNSCQHPKKEVLRHTWGKLVHVSHVVFTWMETVLSWSLLMAFSAAVTVFTISVCFSLSSFCGCKKMKNVGTSTGLIGPAGRCKHSGCLMTTKMLLPVVALPLPHSGSCGISTSVGCSWNSLGRPRQLRSAAEASSDSERTFLLLETMWRDIELTV